MRITRESLLKTARNTVALRTQYNRRLVCIYLTGSLAWGEPLLGGTADIDLVFVHDSEPPNEREIERISNEVHLDIHHLSQGVYNQPRRLRLDPWVGSFLCESPLVLYETQHWFEYTQAAVCSQFDRPEYVIQRARPFADEARQNWMQLFGGATSSPLSWMNVYLNAIEKAGNAIAILSGPPLPERRFFLQLPERAAAIGRPGLAAGLADLIMDGPFDEENWSGFQQSWSSSLHAACENEKAPPVLHACRLPYYTQAAEALWQEHPPAAAWIMLRTWLLAAQTLDEAPAGLNGLCSALHLDVEHFDTRISALDAYLDMLEESLETWSKDNGV